MRCANAVVIGALVAFFIQPVLSDEGVFLWKQSGIGKDPCNPTVGCTLEWALEQSGWPEQVSADLRRQARGRSAEFTEICAGWRGWMTWGKYKPKFRKDVQADWQAGHCESSLLWSTVNAGTRYYLVQVEACHNWGGWTEAAPDKVISRTIPESPTIRLGKTPEVHCPDEQLGCTPCTGRN